MIVYNCRITGHEMISDSYAHEDCGVTGLFKVRSSPALNSGALRATRRRQDQQQSRRSSWGHGRAGRSHSEAQARYAGKNGREAQDRFGSFKLDKILCQAIR
eukprot:scaffold1051_cov254-Pinguiococcus_pyrenoidosus.AAC.12